LHPFSWEKNKDHGKNGVDRLTGKGGPGSGEGVGLRMPGRGGEGRGGEGRGKNHSMKEDG
jgi:hypothetical protein